MIYLLRHGLDDESYIGGHSDVDLVSEGIVQVNDLGIWLREQKLDVDMIYTSDVKRAVTTANIINEYLELPIIENSELRELSKGILTGMKKDIAMEMYPDYMDVRDVGVRYPEGESMWDLYCRIKELLTNFSKYERSIVVTHRGVINIIYYLLNGDELDMDKEKYNVGHASIHELDMVKSKIRRIR